MSESKDIASVEEVVCNHTFSDLDTGPGRVCSRCGADDPNVIGQLIALREALLTGAEPVIGAVSALRHAIALLQSQSAKLSALEKDALRYRWLRKGGYPLCQVDDDAIDTAIDLARGQS